MPSRQLFACTVPEKHASMLSFSYTYSLHKHSRHLLNHVALVLEKDLKWLFIHEQRFFYAVLNHGNAELCSHV